MNHYKWVAGTAALVTMHISTVALANTERQLGSHEHGHAKLNIAISDDQVLAELISPAANIVGFEHAPESEADHEAIESAAETLRNGESLLVFSAAAGCQLTDADVESELLEHDEHHGDHAKHDDHHDDKHDGHKHEDEHDHDKEAHKDHDHDKDEHKDHDHDKEGHKDEHDHDHAADHDEAHSEFHVTWSFTCSKPAQLESLDVKLFDAFSGFEEIDLSIAGENSQASAELSAGNASVEL